MNTVNTANKVNAVPPNSMQPSPYYYTDVYNQPIILKSNFSSNYANYSSLPSSSSFLFIDKNKNDLFYNEYTSTFIDDTSENQNKLIDEEKQKPCTLEKNRIAALKCRERKKLWIEQLTKTHDQKLRKNKILRRKLVELKEEVQQLRNQILIHAK
ncbi:unnamed protein product [Cunninghamella blakesleeana]